jgi:predicted Holliday junction resolvase-like endonuclease
MTYFLSILVIVLSVIVVYMSAWYGSVHPRYRRKFKHQEQELYKASLVNKQLRQVRDELMAQVKHLQKEHDEWKHAAYIYWKRAEAKGNNKQETVTKTVTVNPFTRDELTILIQLCHPDKHGGKPSANAMTQKLNHLRSTTK